MVWIEDIENKIVCDICEEELIFDVNIDFIAASQIARNKQWSILGVGIHKHICNFCRARAYGTMDDKAFFDEPINDEDYEDESIEDLFNHANNEFPR